MEDPLGIYVLVSSMDPLLVPDPDLQAARDEVLLLLHLLLLLLTMEDLHLHLLPVVSFGQIVAHLTLAPHESIDLSPVLAQHQVGSK